MKTNIIIIIIMTRRKDKIRLKQEFTKKTNNTSKSRLGLKQDEKEKEENLLKKIQKIIPDDIIRLIYNYLSGNAKLICNFKFEYLEKTTQILTFYNSFFYNTLDIIEKLSKKELLDMINKGFLRNYPDLIETINDFYYCLDIRKYSNAIGTRLFHLWETNQLVNNYDDVPDFDEMISRIDWSIKYYTKIAVSDYVKNVINLFIKNKSRMTSQKNWIQTENTLFLNIDKVFYIYKCLEDLKSRKNGK